MVHRKTPPKATSSPNTTAESSLVKAKLQSVMSSRLITLDQISDLPHGVPNCLVQVHLPSLASRDIVVVFVHPVQSWCAQGRIARCPQIRRSCNGRRMSACGRRLSTGRLETTSRPLLRRSARIIENRRESAHVEQLQSTPWETGKF